MEVFNRKEESEREREGKKESYVIQVEKIKKIKMFVNLLCILKHMKM